MTDMTDNEGILKAVCYFVYYAQKATDDYNRYSRSELHSGRCSTELLIYKQGKIKVEMRKEGGKHHVPHIHIVHSDKIDASISIVDFRKLAGEIDSQTLRRLVRHLKPAQDKLQCVWEKLNSDNSIDAEVMVDNLFD